ncbi:MAG: ParB N-terminal domain-containing protein [Clostridiales bacterium]|nr:ParB N-terminal domain-containing protein [Clostridiales bacterium]
MSDLYTGLSKLIASGKSAPQSEIINIPLEKLVAFEDVNGIVNPSRVDENDPEFIALVENIAQRGLDHPITVRPISSDDEDNVTYQVLCGHHRVAACKKLNMPNIRAIVKRDLNDDDAAILVATDNYNRKKNYKPSEKAFFYKMALDALKRKSSGRKFSGDEADGRAIETLSSLIGEGTSSIKNYVRLTNLIPQLLDLVDDKTIKIVPAVELSYLSPEDQKTVYETKFNENSDYYDPDTSIDAAQAKRIRARVEVKGLNITPSFVDAELSHTPRAAKLHLTKDIKSMLPSEIRKSPDASKEYVMKAISFYQEHNKEV